MRPTTVFGLGLIAVALALPFAVLTQRPAAPPVISATLSSKPYTGIPPQQIVTNRNSINRAYG